MKPITLTIHGQRWKYLRPTRIVRDGDECDGYCTFDTQTIEVKRSLDVADETETDCHELGHAFMPWADGHRFIDRFGKEFSVALYRLGYRKLTPDQIKQLEAE
jgi:hypothetical protein